MPESRPLPQPCDRPDIHGTPKPANVIPFHWACVCRDRAEAEVERLRWALRTIEGPEDRGPWILIYREAGGGYEGLQAIAAAALGRTQAS